MPSFIKLEFCKLANMDLKYWGFVSVLVSGNEF